MSYIYCKIWVIVMSVLRAQKKKKISSIHKYLKINQKSTQLSGKAWLGVQDGEGAGLNKNMHGSVGPGGFHGGVCVHENSVLMLKYFLKRLFIRESNPPLLVLCCKHHPFKETELEETLRNDD